MSLLGVPIAGKTLARQSANMSTTTLARSSFNHATAHRRSIRFVALGLFLAIGATLVPAFGGLGAVSASAQTADAPSPDQLADDGLVTIDDMNNGALLLETDTPGWFVTAPTLSTDIDVAVSGPIARAVVTQTFRNTSSVFVEGTYVFPLPEGATVDTLRMRVGERWIEGDIAEKAEAREIYETAKAAGQVASLVVQLRPNMFTTSVANIAPGADVIVQIEYQETLSSRDGRFGLRLPLVVAPRYSTSGQQISQLTSTGWSTTTDPSVHRGAVTPRDDDPSTERNKIRHPVNISLAINAGFPLGELTSAHHEIDVIETSATSSQVELVGPVPANRDFLLSWKPASFETTYVAAFSEIHESETHHLAMLTAPTIAAEPADRSPREVIFVQDTSGSMFGDSMDQARAGLQLAIDSLGEDDTFNIIEFNDQWTRFASTPQPATHRNLDRAKEWIDGLRADGGTRMLPALQAALDTDRKSSGEDTDRLRQVVFLTDGAVAQEQALLRLIEQELGDTRLFTVGIGSAPNSYFMSAAARTGRGSFVYISDIDQVEEQMQSLFAKIESAAIVGLKPVGVPEGVEISPSPIPDLYVGDPLVLSVRVPEGVAADLDELVLAGLTGSEPLTLDIDLDPTGISSVGSGPRSGVSKLWARERIRDLEALRLSAGLDGDDFDRIDDQVLEVALEYGIVSRLTSLVAVDVEVTRPADEVASSANVALDLPAGWDSSTFLPQDPDDDFGTNEPALSAQAEGYLEAAAEANAAAAAEAADAVGLPATATNWQLQAMFGIAMTVCGGTYLARSRRRTTR